MDAFSVLLALGLLLILALGCTALVLVAIILSLVPPELEDRHERRSGQSADRGLRRSRQAQPEQGQGGAALQRLLSGVLPPGGRPR